MNTNVRVKVHQSDESRAEDSHRAQARPGPPQPSAHAPLQIPPGSTAAPSQPFPGPEGVTFRTRRQSDAHSQLPMPAISNLQRVSPDSSLHHLPFLPHHRSVLHLKAFPLTQTPCIRSCSIRLAACLPSKMSCNSKSTGCPLEVSCFWRYTLYAETVSIDFSSWSTSCLVQEGCPDSNAGSSACTPAMHSAK